jgi:hypothetical protein
LDANKIARGAENRGDRFRKLRAHGLRFGESVKTAFAIAAVVQPLASQTFGSRLRAEYEKEKNGPHGECRTRWTNLQPGLDDRSINCLGDEDDLDVQAETSQLK